MVDSRTRIAVAFVCGGALVAIAFAVGSHEDAREQRGTIVAEAAVERSHINITDSNSDGVPDWREALQKTEPIILEEATTTYEVPKTVTGKFALDFFEDMLRSKMYGSFGDSKEELVAESIAALQEQTQDVLFLEEDLNMVETSSPEILKAYGNHLASIALSQHGSDENEVIILQDALRYNDPKRLTALDPIASAYVGIVKQMLEAPVPEQYAKEHLDLLNTYNAVKEDVQAMQKVYDDPLYTFIRVKRYQDDALGMSNALSNLFNALRVRDEVVWDDHEPAATLMNALEHI